MHPLTANPFSDRSKHPPKQSAPKTRGRIPRLRSVEAAKFLEHQMYFWGQDVLHPKGNLLVTAGCKRFQRPNSPHAVHCYTLKTPVASITLHSTGVALQPLDGSPGVTYLRPTHRLYHDPQHRLPLPYEKGNLTSLQRILPNEFPPALTTLLTFVRAYEQWAAPQLPPGARLAAWREQKTTATRGVRWLKPKESLEWLDACLTASHPDEPHSETFPFPIVGES